MAAEIRMPGSPGGLASEIGEALLRGASLDGLFACDRSAAVSFCDAAAARFLQMGDTDPVGLPLAQLLAGLDDQTLELRFLSALRDRTPIEFVVARPAGDDEWVEVVGLPTDGGPGRVVGVTLDVTASKLAEAKLTREVAERRRAEERQQLLIHELNHRVKNMLATVQSVARQSLGRAGGAGPLADFEERLMALAWTHDILTRERWAGASLATVLSRTMTPHGPGRVALKGPDLRISPKMALALAMGVHELATNAVKYGALSADKGHVEIVWRLDETVTPARLRLEWRERGGPRVTPPATRGFGARLLERGLAHELGGQVVIRFLPAGVRCEINAPFDPEPADPPELPRSAFEDGRAAAH